MVIQFALLIIFHNLYNFFKGFEAVDLTQIQDPVQLMDNIKKIKWITFPGGAPIATGLAGGHLDIGSQGSLGDID